MKSFDLRAGYAGIAGNYELLNHLMTLGRDSAWRDRAAALAALGGGERWLDACAGTGEMTARLARAAPAACRVVAADFCPEMLERARSRPEAPLIDFLHCDVRRLPMAPASVDLVTLAFAARNLETDRAALVAAFAEFHRVLRPGGRFVNLETSQPTGRILRAGFRAWTAVAVGLAVLASGRGGGCYRFLAESIAHFHTAEELAAVIREAGFQRVNYQRLLGGAAAIHVAIR